MCCEGLFIDLYMKITIAYEVFYFLQVYLLEDLLDLTALY